jgi:hypothetical protein
MRIALPHLGPGLPGRSPAAILLAGAVALLVGGCGKHLVKVDSSVLRLRIDEYSITPQDVQVHAGRLKITAVNTGVLTHNVRVELDHPAANGSPLVPGCVLPAVITGCGTPIIEPGQKMTSPKLTLPPGHYRLVDTIANHADLGDYGTLTVVP